MSNKINYWEVAQEYINEGLKIVPIPYGKKGIKTIGWGLTDITNNNIDEYFTHGKDTNIGVILKNNIVDIDLDSQEAVMLASSYLPESTYVWGRSDYTKAHALFRVDSEDNLYKKDYVIKNDGKPYVEFRIARNKKGEFSQCQSILPYSKHENTGKIISFYIQNKLPMRKLTTVNGKDLFKQTAKLGSASMLLRHYPDTGQRETFILALSGLLSKNGWNEDDVLKFLDPIIEKNDDEDDRTSTIISTCRKYERGGTVSGYNDLKDIIGEERVKKLCEWLNLNDKSEQLNDWDEPYYPKEEDALELNPEWIPEVFRKYCLDISKSASVPIDYPCISLYIAIAGVCGKRFYCNPKKNQDNWKEYPTLYGGVVGPPSVKKTPGTKPIFDIVQEIDDINERQYNEDKKKHNLRLETWKVLRKDKIQEIRKAKTNNDRELKQIELEKLEKQIEDSEPKDKTIMIQSGTIEAYTELMQKTEEGLLLYIDELTNLFKTFEKSGHESDRSMILQWWNGNGILRDVKIGRGKTTVRGLCASIMGTIQPSKIWLMIEDTNKNGDDGLMPRFNSMVYPKTVEYDWFDEKLEETTYQRLKKIFREIHKEEKLDGYKRRIPQEIKLDDEAYEINKEWQIKLEKRKKEGFENQNVEAMLGKYNGLILKYALLNYIVEWKDSKTNSCKIEKKHIEMAKNFVAYLESHSNKIQSIGGTKKSKSSEELLKKIYEKKVSSQFKLQEVYQKEWKYLRKIGKETSKDVCLKAIKDLEINGWVKSIKDGRSIIYHIHPQFDEKYREKVIFNGQDCTKSTKSTESNGSGHSNNVDYVNYVGREVVKIVESEYGNKVKVYKNEKGEEIVFEDGEEMWYPMWKKLYGKSKLPKKKVKTGSNIDENLKEEYNELGYLLGFN